MCERSKTEILARELCNVQFMTINRVGYNSVDRDEYIEGNWSSWTTTATRILETLEKHND